MPIEDIDEEGTKKMPNLELSQALFTLQCQFSSEKEKEEAKIFLEKDITEYSK